MILIANALSWENGMPKQELIWTFEQFNNNGAFNRTLDALRKDQLAAAAEYARLDHARLLGAARAGKQHDRLGKVTLPPFYLPEVNDAIAELDRHIHGPAIDAAEKPLAEVSASTPVKQKLPGKDAREAALHRADYKCESCGLPHHAVGYRTEAGDFVPCKGDTFRTPAGQGRSWPSGEILTLAEAKQIADLLNTTIKRQIRCDAAGHHWLVIVLTVMKKNPANKSADLENLTVLCRQCKASGKS